MHFTSRCLLAACGALLAACSGESHASHDLAPIPPAPPAVIVEHPLVQLERALEDPETERDEFWRLGTEVLGWDVALTGKPEAYTAEQLRGWIEDDLRLFGVGDWPYETRYANYRAPGGHGVRAN